MKLMKNTNTNNNDNNSNNSNNANISNNDNSNNKNSIIEPPPNSFEKMLLSSAREVLGVSVCAYNIAYTVYYYILTSYNEQVIPLHYSDFCTFNVYICV